MSANEALAAVGRATPERRPIDGLLDDRPDADVFRVDRRAFTDAAVFELELQRVFESTWVFLGLESELAAPHDFCTRRIGRQSVLLTRDGSGELRCFLNSCRHRGTLLCPLGRGNRAAHVCRYHGWSYDSAGRNVAVTGEAVGEYPARFTAENRDLVPVARLASYRGFVFASLAADVPSLEEHLGGAAAMLDLVADQAPDGLEYVPGSISYTFEANWKLQFENGLDAYHFPATHGAFVDIIRRRPVREADDVASVLPEGVASGTIAFPRGHAVSWSLGAPGQGPENRPLPKDPALLARVHRQAGDARLDWMLRQRNLTVFPNLQVIDIQSLQVRTWEPLAVDRTLMHSHCLAPIGESAEARRFRIRQYEEFFNAGGLATSDDNVMYEYMQTGLACTAAGPPQAYDRGMAAPRATAEPFAALDLGEASATFSDAGLAFGDETGIHAGYREWFRLLGRGEAG